MFLTLKTTCLFYHRISFFQNSCASNHSPDENTKSSLIILVMSPFFNMYRQPIALRPTQTIVSNSRKANELLTKGLLNRVDKTSIVVSAEKSLLQLQKIINSPSYLCKP